MGSTYLLQLLHGRLVCLLPAQHVGAMAVAVLCVGVTRDMRLSSTTKRVVLLGYVLGEVGRNHLFDLVRGVLVHEGAVLGSVWVAVLTSAVSHAIAQAFVVVAQHQGGVGIVQREGVIAQDVRMLRNGRAPRVSTPRRSDVRWRDRGRVGRARFGGAGGI